MAYTEILTSHDLTAEQWQDSIFETYLGMLWWHNLMGVSEMMPIVVAEDLTKLKGDAVTVGLMGEMQGGKVTGNAKGIGNEGQVSFFGQRIVVDNVRRVIKAEDVPMSSQRVNFDFLMKVRRALEKKFKEDLDDDITSALSDTSVGRVQGRYLYGAVDSNWNATHATALQNIDNSADQLTTNMISIAKRKAVIPVNANSKIEPAMIMNGTELNAQRAPEEWFFFVGHTYAMRDMLLNDSAWTNAQLNIPPQANSNSPLFSGSWFKGAWNGVLCYEYDRINLISSTIQVAHNLFFGAKAGAVAWAQRSRFDEEPSDFKHDISYELHEIRGVEKLRFTKENGNEEDQGLVNVFSAAVAD